MLVTQARYVAPDISGVSKSRVKMLEQPHRSTKLKMKKNYMSLNIRILNHLFEVSVDL